MRPARMVLVLLTIGLMTCGAVAKPPNAKPKATPSPPPYLRVSRDAKGNPRAMQTAIRSFVGPQGQKVDLVAAVHLADPAYYAALNKRFKGYHRVLYEMVLDVGAGDQNTEDVVPDFGDGQDASTLSQVQMMLCRLLGLEFQLQGINYAAPNFVHADMTAAELGQAMTANHESAMTLLMKVFKIALKDSTTVGPEELRALDKLNPLALLSRPPTPEEQLLLRRVMAGSFREMDTMLSELQGSSLVGGRNQKALQVLKRELGRGHRKLAIFYGAAHMNDMEQRLTRDLKFKPVGETWLSAWSLVAPAKPGKKP